MRLLRANEIDVRVGQCKENGASLLLYKNARVDMQIMDETFGAEYWKREHIIINTNNYCKVSVFNKEIKEWVSKEDCGTESMTEKEKGEASDSFKRACVNWGIGRELYTPPFMWLSKDVVSLTEYEVNKKKKYKTFDKFKVTRITYNSDREIENLVIVNQKDKVVFSQIKKELPQNYLQNLQITAKEKNYDAAAAKELIYTYCKKNSSKDLTIDEAKALVKHMKANPIEKEEKKEEAK